MIKRLLIIIMVSIIAVLTVACGSQVDVTNEIATYQAEANARLNELESNVADLRADLENVDDEAGQELATRIDALKSGIQDARQQVEAVSNETADTWEAARDEADSAITTLEEVYQEHYAAVAEARLRYIERQIAELREQAVDATEDIQVDLNSTIEDLEAQADDLQTEIDGLREATGEAWNDAQSGVEEALTVLEQAFTEAVNEFN